MMVGDDFSPARRLPECDVTDLIRNRKEECMTEKILLVDDDSNILDGYRRSLSREFRLETAMGGEQALKITAENEPYAVVVSDMRMPGMDGIQLLCRIKAQSPDTTRVILTGNADIEMAINAINRGQHLPLPQQAVQQGNDGEDFDRGFGPVPARHR